MTLSTILLTNLESGPLLIDSVSCLRYYHCFKIFELNDLMELVNGLVSSFDY